MRSFDLLFGKTTADEHISSSSNMNELTRVVERKTGSEKVAPIKL